MTNDIHIFIGPRKTGTSWLHHVAGSESAVKEIRYPSVFGRSYVFRRYVQGRSVLIWPYLIHEPAALKALLEDVEQAGCNPCLYFSEREKLAWIDSMSRFLMKYGESEVIAQRRATEEYEAVQVARIELEKTHSVKTIKIIDPTDLDLKLLALACNTTVPKLEKARDLRVYETNETVRIPSECLVDLFFRLKAFMPNSIQQVTKLKVLRKFFFRDASGKPRT